MTPTPARVTLRLQIDEGLLVESAGEAMAEVRELTLEDLMKGSAPSNGKVARLRDSHHNVARLLAGGKKVQEVALISGYTPAHIHSLQQDQAFKELVEHYRERVEEVFLDAHSRIAALAADSVQELHLRLHENAESFSNNQLLEIAKTTLDRSGHGPSSTKNINAKVVLSEEQLAQIKSLRGQSKVLSIEEASQNSRATVLDADFEPVAEEEPARIAQGGARV